MKKLVIILRKSIFAILILYTYNTIAVSYNLLIPINMVTLVIVSFLDIPGLFMLGIILKLLYWG